MAVVDKNNLEQEACILRFYKIVLSWDYLQLLQPSEKNKKTKKEASDLGLKAVKDKYKDVDDYLSTFEPLLFEEVKAQISQRKDEEEEMEWMTSLVVDCNEVDGFHLLAVFGDSMESISQNDLLLLSQKEFGGDTKLPTNYAFALVEHRQMDKIRLRMHLTGGVKRVTTDEGEPSQRLSNMCSLVSEKNRAWRIMKICSLSTIAREYVALRSISYLPYKDLILTATESNKNSEDRAWKISSTLSEFIKNNHNESQQMAIDVFLAKHLSSYRYKTEKGVKLEPIEEVTIEVNEEHVGLVMEALSNRRAEITDMAPVPGNFGRTRMTLTCPSRGLVGYRSVFSSDTRGTGFMHRAFLKYEKYRGPLGNIRKGVLVSMARGTVTAYALMSLEPRGTLFVTPGMESYDGMIVGEHSRDTDLDVNPVRNKELNNIRAAGKDENVKLSPPRRMTLEEAIGYVASDELIEVTPNNIRLRKRYLDANKRKTMSKKPRE